MTADPLPVRLGLLNARGPQDLLVFILSLGYYVTPALVGGPSDQMISYFIALYTNETLNWGLASALGCVLMLVTGALYVVFNRFGDDKLRRAA